MTTTSAASASGRRPYLDWLRVIVVMMLIPFHTAMTFSPYPWYLRNNELSQATRALVQVLNQYHMELLFVVAGIATAEDADTTMTLGFNWPAGPLGMGAGARAGWGEKK